MEHETINKGKEEIEHIEAQHVLERLNGWNKPTKVVIEGSLPLLLCQEGTGCDCKGCDSD